MRRRREENDADKKYIYNNDGNDTGKKNPQSTSVQNIPRQ